MREEFFKSMGSPNWFDAAERLVKIRRYDAALAVCRGVIKKDPWNVEALLYQAYLLAELFRNYSGAVECYDAALRIEPKNASIWLLKGKAFHNLDKFRKAIACYKKALRIEPRHPEAWRDWGDALNCLGQAKKALEAYRRAAEGDPRNASLWYLMGLTYDDIDRTADAAACFQKVLELAPPDKEELRHQARIKLEELGAAR